MRGFANIRNIEGGPVEWSPKIKALFEWGAPQLLARLEERAPDDVGAIMETSAPGMVVAFRVAWVPLETIRAYCRKGGMRLASIEMADPGEGNVRFFAEALDGEAVACRVPLSSVRRVFAPDGPPS